MAGKIFVSVILCLCIHLGFTQNFGFQDQYGYTQNYGDYYKNQQNNRYPSQSYDNYGRPVRLNGGQTTWRENRRRNPQREIWQLIPVPEQNFNREYHGQPVRFPGSDNNYKPTEPATVIEYIEIPSQNVNFPKNPESEQPFQPEYTENSQTLPPLTPVEEAHPPQTTTAVYTSAPEYTTLPPLTPAAQTENNEPFIQVGTTTLPPLTPVLQSASRSDFDFGTPVKFNDPCELEGAPGVCLPLLKCEPFANMLAKARTDPQVVTLLRKAHCGFEGNNPKVCCPAQSIPDHPPPNPIPDSTPSPTSTSTQAPVEEREEKEDDDDASDFIHELPAPPICGNSSASLTRVVGGIDARLGDFPWMALLGYKTRTGNTDWKCGGTLVSSKHVLTAAHCMHGLENSLHVVRLGEHDLAKDEDGAHPIDVPIKKMIEHEHYNRSTLTNDIGILVLERHVPFTEQIKPICIPTSSELRAKSFENYNPLVAGWGSLAFRGPAATVLQVLQLPVVSNSYCAQKFAQYKQLSIDNRVLCAGYKRGGKDACQGDSGGPLMQPVWNKQDLSTIFYQIGVVSFGKKCAEPEFPGVYTRVTTFVPWIEQKMLGPNAKGL